MRVAILQRSQKHTEVFGFIMEYCKRHKIELDIYVVKYGFWYGPYFNTMLGTNYPDYNALEITPAIMKKYDYVFATSASEVRSIRGLRTSRIFFLHHIPGRVRPVGKNICLTPLVPNCTYLFPVYNGSSEIVQKENIFSIVGHLGARNINDLGRTLRHSKYKNRKFKIFIFTRSKLAPKDKRITVFPFCKTEMMIAKLKRSKFLLSIPKPGSFYFKDRLSGELPLAYSHNIPICLPQQLNTIYNLTGVVQYKRSLIEVFDRLLTMKGQPYLDLVGKVQRQRNQIIKTNHRRIRKLMKLNKPK